MRLRKEMRRILDCGTRSPRNLRNVLKEPINPRLSEMWMK